MGRKINKLIEGVVNQNEINDFDNAYIIVDENNKIVFRILKNGAIEGNFILKDESILLNNLSMALQETVPETIESDFSGYSYLITDTNDKIAFAIKTDGTVVAKLELADSSIFLSMLNSEILSLIPTADFLRINEYNANDIITLPDDGGWHSNEVELPIKTALNGVLFERIPKSVIDKVFIYSDTALQIRKNNPFIRGKRNRGNYAPSLTSSDLITRKGYFTSASVSLPSSPVEGDYYLVDIFSTVSQPYVVGGLSLYDNDILYYKSGSWNRLVFPFTSAIDGDFLVITGNGKWFDIDLVVGDKLLFLTTKSESGYSKPIVLKQQKNEFYCLGEYSVSSFSGLTLYNNDLVVCSEDGTYGNITCKAGDYVGKLKSTLFRFPAELVDIPTNTGLTIETKDIAIRRTDKSITQKEVKAFGMLSTAPARPSKDLALHSDSMFGVQIGSAIASQFPDRTVITISHGGAKSAQILGMIRYYIINGDPYRLHTNVFYHGQNNSTDLVQIKNASMEFAELMIAGNQRFIIWSQLGAQTFGWNGTRITCTLHENAFAGTGNNVELENWHDIMFPNRHFNTRKEALLSAESVPSMHFPGLTERQVADTYGITPSQYHHNLVAIGKTPSDLVFTGYKSTSGLPTGGTNNDYQIRTANGTIGEIMVNNNGTWVALAIDAVHVMAYGGLKLSERFKLFVNNNKF